MDAEKRLYAIRKQREHWADIAAKMGGVSDVRVQVTDQRSPTEEAAVHLADLTAELDDEERKYVQIVQDAKEVIAKIPQERFRTVLTLRYICGHSWLTIWDEMEYTGRNSVYKVHGYALRAAQRYIEDSK